MASTHCPPGATPAPPICGWAPRSFRLDPCQRPAEDDSPFCATHQAVEKRIATRATKIAGDAKRRLTSEERLSRTALREISNSRALAEKWWTKSGARYIPEALYYDVLYSGPCAYCGSTVPRVVDHVLPIAQGGFSDPDNLVPACTFCNAEKADLTPDQWREKRAEQGLSWPPDSPIVQVTKAVEEMMAEDSPHFLDDLVYEPLPRGVVRPADCMEDPRWQVAQSALAVRDVEGPERHHKILRKVAAIELQYKVEVEYESAGAGQ